VTEQPMPIQMTETENDSIYIVKPNDSLSKVFGERWREIAAYNQIESPYVIFVGQDIKVPLQ